MHGTTISRVCHKDYLGYTISDDLNDNQAIIKEKRGIYARGNMLHRKFKTCNNEVKKKLFVSYCKDKDKDKDTFIGPQEFVVHMTI